MSRGSTPMESGVDIQGSFCIEVNTTINALEALMNRSEKTKMNVILRNLKSIIGITCLTALLLKAQVA